MLVTKPVKKRTKDTSRLNVLLLYNEEWADNSTTYDHLRAFRQLSSHDIYYSHDYHEHPDAAALEAFDGVAVHYSLVARQHPWLTPALATALKDYRGVKALFLSDEYGKTDAAPRWCRELGITIVFTTMSADDARIAYPGLADDDVLIVPVAARHLPLGCDHGLRPTYQRLVQSFDDAIKSQVWNRNRHTLTSLVTVATDVCGKTTPLLHNQVTTEPINATTGDALRTWAKALGDLEGPDLLQTVCQGRLSTQVSIPVSAASTSGDRTLYFVPYRGNRIGLYDGKKWQCHVFPQQSIILSTVRENQNYDVFLTYESGALALRLFEWADDHNRRTPLALQDGILVHREERQRRYLGTIRGSGNGTTEDSLTNRYVWNFYHQVSKHLYISETTAHTYNQSTPRHWNNDSKVRFGFVVGQPQDITVHCNALLKANKPGVPALLYPTLDGSLDLYPELGRYLGNYNPHFIGTTASGSKMLEPGFHTIGVAECSDGAGATYANVWLHGSVLC